MPVPQQIIQFWDSRDNVPARIQRATQSWMMHPGFTYRCFDDRQARQFLTENLPSAVTDAYEQAAHPVLRADLFRYAALYVLGGVYIDADDICLRFPDDIIARCPGLTLVRKSNGVVSNNFIVAAPGHRVLGAVLDQTVANILQRVSNNIWEVSGPLLIDRLIRSVGSASIEILSLGEYRRWIGSSRPEGNQVHWSDFQRRHSIFTTPIDTRAPGLFDLIEKIPVPAGVERARFLAAGLDRRNCINRLLEAANRHVVSLERVAIIDDHDFAISRWFYPLQLTLQIICVFERRDGLRVPAPLNFALTDYRGLAAQDASAAGLDLVIVPDPAKSRVGAQAGLTAEQLHSSLRADGMVITLRPPPQESALRQALIDLGMRATQQSDDATLYCR